MIQVYRYDENFVFVEPIPIEEPGEDGKYVIPEIVQPFSLHHTLNLCFTRKSKSGQK